jgi:hypothetical protein
MRVKPGAVEELVIDWGATGATLGVRLLDNQGATTIARATGFVEYPAGSGVYYLAAYTFPDDGGDYTLLYDDDGGTAAVGHVATEGVEVTSSAPAEPPTGDTYATADELARRLKIRAPSAEQTAQMDQVLLMAAGEINSEIDLAVDVDLESWQLALAAEVNLKRAVELWAESPFGILGLETAELFATHTARNTWERYAHMLAPLKDQWGLA